MLNHNAIEITKDHKIIIKENAFSLVLDDSDIRYIEELSDKFYYKEDIKMYFENNSDIYTDDVMYNKYIFENILNAYFDYRRENDGDPGMSWRECLDKAVRDFEFELEVYRRDYQSSKRVYCEKQLSKFLFFSKQSKKYNCELLWKNKDLFELIHKDYYYHLKQRQKDNDDSFECLNEVIKNYENELKEYCLNAKKC